MSTPKSTHRSSPAWHFFRKCDDDETRVVCTLCHRSLKRGINTLNLSTTCMTRHLSAKHELQWNAQMKNHEPSEAPPAPSSAAVSASSSRSRSTGPPGSPQREDVIAPALSPSISTSSHRSVQLSIPQRLERKRKYPPTHPRALALNDCISKFLAFEMLPFRLVETDSFKKLMAIAVPHYVVPSRHYFSRRAIPALHTNVTDKIRCALRNAISGKVHITTDTWTSKHGQERYISLTAHWVNVVATEVEGDLMHVLPPPRIAGQFSIHVASSLYSESSTTSSSSQHNICATNFCTAKGKRQQAVLKLICLGEKSHTAQELWTGIKQQIDEWLVPLNLKPGLVVCDNGRSLIAALGLANLMHIPCLAHVLNLVVQSFLKNYPEMSELLQKVRAICARFRRSQPAAASLSELQRLFCLPAHNLICDVPTKWNSTLHMLERLCEQKQAIVEFQLQHAQVSRSVDQYHFTTNEWDSMQNVCAVLRCFEFSTNMASADDAIISVTIPLLCLLQKTLQTMMSEVVPQEEEVEEKGSFTRLSGQSSTLGSEGEFLNQQQLGTQVSSQGTVLEDEEEEEEDEEPSLQQGGTQSSSRTSLERGWGDTEDPDDTPPTEDSLSPLGSLAHMSQYMLLCLRNDRRVARIVTSDDYWVATLLDPRYKDNVPSLLPSPEWDCKMQEYKRMLVDALLTAFPPDSGGSVEEQGRGEGEKHQRSWGSITTSGGRISIAEMWKTFLSTPQLLAPPSEMVHISRRQRFNNMVEDYLSTHLHVLSDGSAPFNFWVSKLDIWPELARYALEVLACPAGSVLSEHVFRIAGGVRTDKRIRLSTANVSKLTFIKMNQAWIPQDLSVPLAD
ncbi:zinc finger BED domain-containing protein 4-like [Ranitomeya variabilis]|uniref:zinc finger BED domain-containing protein 4-like n=1 Tax=Ranitomeya variabilis TaxID=490064 RepID=UPI0040571728